MVYQLSCTVHGGHLSLNQQGKAEWLRCRVCRAISISPDSGTPLLVPAHGAHHTLLLAHFPCHLQNTLSTVHIIMIHPYPFCQSICHRYILVNMHFPFSYVLSASSLNMVIISILFSPHFVPILLLFLFQLILYNLSSPDQPPGHSAVSMC